MTKIPEGYRAARELHDAFLALGQERGEQPAPRRSLRSWLRERLRRLFVLVPVALLTLVAAAEAAHVFLDDGPDVSGDRGVPADIRRAQHDAALADVRADDPDGGLPWGERLYSSTTDGRCAIVGRVSDGVLGLLRDGRFSALAADAPGACGSPGAQMLVTRHEAAASPMRSVLFGFVDRSVRSMVIVDHELRTPVPIASDGSFLLVTSRRAHGTLVLSTGGHEIRRDLG